MSDAKPGEVVNIASDGVAMFHCPGCHCVHAVNIPPSMSPCVWSWNGDRTKPTVTPSIKVTMPEFEKPDKICHSFVRDGKIEFLSDCTHALAGQTVPLPPWLMLL